MIAEFIAHLDAQLSIPVEYAYDANPVDAVADLPRLFVYPGDPSAEPSQTDNFVRQQLNEQVNCILVCKVADYETHIQAIRQAALGYTFGAYDAFEFSDGETLELKGGVISIRETYLTRHLITEGA